MPWVLITARAASSLPTSSLSHWVNWPDRFFKAASARATALGSMPPNRGPTFRGRVVGTWIIYTVDSDAAPARLVSVVKAVILAGGPRRRWRPSLRVHPWRMHQPA